MQALIRLYLHLFTSAFAYKVAIKSGWWIVLLFFVLTHSIVSVLAVAGVYTQSLPRTLEETRSALHRSEAFVPNATQFTWDVDQEELSVGNADLPIQIPMSLYTDLPSFNRTTQMQLPKYFITIPDFSEDSSELQTDSLLVVQPDGLQVQGRQPDDYTTVAYATLPQFEESFTVDGSFFFAYMQQSLDKIEQTLYRYWPVFLLLALPITMGLTVTKLILDAFFIILLVKINQYSITVSESIRLSILMAGVSAVVSQIAIMLYPEVGWPFYTITFWLIACYVLLLNRRFFTRA